MVAWISSRRHTVSPGDEVEYSDSTFPVSFRVKASDDIKQRGHLQHSLPAAAAFQCSSWGLSRVEFNCSKYVKKTWNSRICWEIAFHWTSQKVEWARNRELEENICFGQNIFGALLRVSRLHWVRCYCSGKCTVKETTRFPQSPWHFLSLS